ncbi:hypothetical protein L1887_48086 [Cichorium endivia]|nr:hypothetical protein L1887_48086 [Cichorium endivia]
MSGGRSTQCGTGGRSDTSATQPRQDRWLRIATCYRDATKVGDPIPHHRQVQARSLGSVPKIWKEGDNVSISCYSSSEVLVHEDKAKGLPAYRQGSRPHGLRNPEDDADLQSVSPAPLPDSAATSSRWTRSPRRYLGEIERRDLIDTRCIARLGSTQVHAALSMDRAGLAWTRGCFPPFLYFAQGFDRFRQVSTTDSCSFVGSLRLNSSRLSNE